MRAIRIFVASLFLLAFASIQVPAALGNDAKPRWEDSSIGSQAWDRLPGTDEIYGQVPSVGSFDPFVYEYRLACLAVDEAIFPACAANLPGCTVAGGGAPVYWYRSLKSAVPPSWAFDSGPTCIYSEKPRDILAEIAAQISHEFQKSPVQPATIGSQPGPHTLRGQETNFYADAHEQQFNITLLGQQIHITATPVAYTWNYGDGTLRGPTPSAGAPLPEDRIGEQTKTSHVYTATGKYTITATTHFNGSYTVNNGPTLPIPDQGHIQSAPLGLTVWRAVTNNYADNCNQNPNGVGC